MKCFKCEEDLEKIGIADGFPPVSLMPSKELASLYVCTSRDCGNCGLVVAIPHNLKED